VEDIAREVGLEYAKSLPVAIGVLVGLLIVAAWAAYKVKDEERATRNAWWTVLAIGALFLVVQLPFAYNEAKSECRAEYRSALNLKQTAPSLQVPGFPAARSSPLLGETPITYRYSKCAKVFSPADLE
jgi:hypothetical protein